MAFAQRAKIAEWFFDIYSCKGYARRSQLSLWQRFCK